MAKEEFWFYLTAIYHSQAGKQGGDAHISSSETLKLAKLDKQQKKDYHISLS